jgi:protein tyrosine/serine phosphatase
MVACHAPYVAGASGIDSDGAIATTSPAITRFDRVDERLYRGGQPDAAGFEQLKRLGIRTVVNLRQNASERALVEGLGMRYVDLSTSLAPFSSLDDGTVRRFFEVMNDETSGPVFLHCRRGADRTGTLVAMYRIARQGWTAKAAYDEARAVGMRWWYFPIKGQLQQFAASTREPSPLPVVAPALP